VRSCGSCATAGFVPDRDQPARKPPSGEAARLRDLLGFPLLKQDGWSEPMGSGTQIEIQVRAPATTHFVMVVQLGAGSTA
jgi:hypothetical protein